MTMWFLLVAQFLLCFIVTTTSLAFDGGGGQPVIQDEPDSPPLVLVENFWISSALNVRIAKKIIEKYFPETKVELRPIQGYRDTFNALANGTAHAALEIWPSGLTEAQKILLEHADKLSRLGPLGIIGKIGWFVPKWFVDQNPGAATWGYYTDPDNVKAFATDETGDLGRFLGVNPDYSFLDDQIIQNLGLALVETFSGSEEASLEILEEVNDSKTKPLLMYWWTPEAAVGKYDLVNVQLPSITDECALSLETNDGNYSCGYPPDVTLKYASSTLKKTHPQINEFLENMNMINDYQLTMLPRVVYDNETVDDVASDWVDANDEIWVHWLPPDIAFEILGTDPVVLVENPWTTSALNVEIVRQILRQEYPDIPVTIDKVSGYANTFARLSSGAAHAVLEVWPSGLSDTEIRTISSGNAVELGPLGVEGQIGWYVPYYVIQMYPEAASWQFYTLDSTAQIFASDETNSLGGLHTITSVSSPDTTSINSQIIRNLGMPFIEVVEEDVNTFERALKEADQQMKPILVSWWSPDAVVAKYNLTAVKLPPVTDACLESLVNGDGLYNCSYPPNILNKYGSPKLRKLYPKVFAFVELFMLTNHDQLSMLENVVVGGVSIERVASDWVKRNSLTWKEWIRIANRAKPVDDDQEDENDMPLATEESDATDSVDEKSPDVGSTSTTSEEERFIRSGHIFETVLVLFCLGVSL